MCFGKDHPYKQLRTSLKHQNQEDVYYDVSQLDPNSFEKLPFCLRVLLESTVRQCDRIAIDNTHVNQILNWPTINAESCEFPFLPSRVIMHEFSGLPAIIDLAAMRDAAVRLGADPFLIQPQVSTTLLLDCYNIEADVARKIVRKTTDQNSCATLECGYELCPFHQEKTVCTEAIGRNQQLEFERNVEKFQIMKWSSTAFLRLSIVPPGTGVCQQINHQYLAKLMICEEHQNDKQTRCVYPDSLIGTDTHTTISNGFGVLSYNMGTIEAETAMFGQPIHIRLSNVIIGCRLVGQPHFMSTSVDLISSLMKFLRQIGLRNKYLEFFGSGLKYLSVGDRSSISYLCVDQGALLAYFPWDESCLNHFSRLGHDATFIERMKNYLIAAKLFNGNGQEKNIIYTDVYEFDLCTVTPNCSGPKRAQDKLCLSSMKSDFQQCLLAPTGFRGFNIPPEDINRSIAITGDDILKHGSITLASIMGGTNGISHATSLLITGLLAEKALKRGLQIPNFTQIYFSPGSGLATNYLKESGTLKALEDLGFRVTGYGCSTCNQNEENAEFQSTLKQFVTENNLITVGMVTAARQNQSKHTANKATYITSPPVVLAYALAGNAQVDLENDLIQTRSSKMSLREIWPTREEVEKIQDELIMKRIFHQIEENINRGNDQWNSVQIPPVESYPQYPWAEYSTYISRVPFFDSVTQSNEFCNTVRISNARVLLYLGDEVSNDHISPAGPISRNSPAAKYLMQKGISPRDFNSFGSRRGNDHVMVRGTFNHPRLNNKLVTAKPIPLFPSSTPAPTTTTLHLPSKLELDVFDASELYRHTKTPLIILAGKDYGCGPSRDWITKGPWTLGVRAVLAESFEAQHRSNLIGMSILPLQFQQGDSCASLNLTGREIYSIEFNIRDESKLAIVQLDNGNRFNMIARVDTEIERRYMIHNGLLPYVLRQMINAN